jgi:DnaJ domain
LVPPIGIGMLVWSVFRSFFSPLLTLGFDRLFSRLPLQYRDIVPIQNILNRQWGHYDPSTESSSFSAEQERFFRYLFGEFARAFEEESRRTQNRRWYRQNDDQRTYRQESSSDDKSNNQSNNQYSRQAAEEQFSKQDLYGELGVNKKATTDEIRQAFRKKLLQYHPDHYEGKDPEFAKRKTQKIVDAYRVLNNATKRAEYDAHSGR